MDKTFVIMKYQVEARSVTRKHTHMHAHTQNNINNNACQPYDYFVSLNDFQTATHNT